MATKIKKKNQPQPQNNKSQKMAVIVSICVAAIIVIGVAVGLILNMNNEKTQSTSGTPDQTAPSETNAPAGNADPGDVGLHHVSIDIADYGTITLELDGSAAPITVQNFLDLAGSGFYDGLTFHRIMEGFMMQGGDPLGNGTGGSDHQIKGEFASNGWDNPISHTRGTVSMARSQMPDSASSQFFICHEDADFLDGSYAAFGHVTDGMDVVDAICTTAQPIDGNGTIPADQQPVITKVTVID